MYCHTKSFQWYKGNLTKLRGVKIYLIKMRINAFAGKKKTQKKSMELPLQNAEQRREWSISSNSGFLKHCEIDKMYKLPSSSFKPDRGRGKSSHLEKPKYLGSSRNFQFN